jgi:hypothetical protein
MPGWPAPELGCRRPQRAGSAEGARCRHRCARAAASRSDPSSTFLARGVNGMWPVGPPSVRPVISSTRSRSSSSSMPSDSSSRAATLAPRGSQSRVHVGGIPVSIADAAVADKNTDSIVLHQLDLSRTPPRWRILPPLILMFASKGIVPVADMPGWPQALARRQRHRRTRAPRSPSVGPGRHGRGRHLTCAQVTRSAGPGLVTAARRGSRAAARRGRR